MQARPAAPIASRERQRSALRARLALPGAEGSGAPALRRLSLAPLLALAATLALTAPAALAATPTLTLEPVTNVAITNAEVHGTVDPGTEFTTYYIQFTTQAAYEAEGFGPETQSPVIEGIEGSGPQPVGGTIAGMHPNTTYRLRLYAENGSGHEEIVEAATFTTKPATAPALHLNTPTEASYQRVHLSATIDPEGGNANPGEPEALPIQWQFQVQKASEPETWQFAGAGVIEGAQAESNSPIEVPADPTGLSPETEYQARLLVTYVGSEQLIGAEEPSFETLPVAKPIVTENPVGAITATTAHFSGEVNPNAPKEAAETSEAEQEAFLTHWRFECAPECPGLEGEVQADDAPNEVSAEASGLTPGQPYSVILVAEDAGGKETSAPVLFTTKAVEPQIDATFASAVSETEATLKAKVNPGGAATTFHFEYLTEEQFEEEGGFSSPETKRAPEPDGAAGSNYEDHTLEATISGLTPGTAYRFRTVATNEKSPSGGTAGPAKGFTATSPSTDFTGKCPANEQLRRENNSTALADCRAYEMVSPLAKSGFDAYAAEEYPAQASPSGDRLFYAGTSDFPTAAGSSLFPVGHLSSRSPAGWQATELNPPEPQPVGGAHGEYNLTEDLSQLVVKIPFEELAPGATPGVQNLFLRNADGSGPYSWVNSATPTVVPPEGCVPAYQAYCFLFEDNVAFAGGSADFSHILFETDAQLEPEAPPSGTPSLYEKSGEQVHLVGVLPDTHLSATSTAGSGINVYGTGSRVENAISADGSRVVFQAPSDESPLFPEETGQKEMTQVYDRIDGSHTIELSAPNPGATPENPAAAPATFWAASKDGSRVFFTSAAELTTASKTGDEGGEDLYEYDFEKPASERLTDLSVDAAQHGARIMGVVNASADGHYVYFVAKGQLDGGKGVEGQPNLYLVKEGGAPVFITTLSESDGYDWTSDAKHLTSYVTPDGKHVAFMSTRSLPSANFPAGYDNTDRATEGANSEVYVYSAETGELLCGSCDPSGARPTGNALIGGSTQPVRNPVNTVFHHVRALSDNGARLFFSSSDQLAGPPAAPGSFLKVYEYERGGEGSCASSLGCHYLLSGPNQSTNDVFLDASANGKHVFFASRARLTPTDVDSSIDVYDAHVEGGYPQPPPPPQCEGDGCRGARSEAPGQPSTATSHFEGREEGPMHPRCAKGKVKRHGRCVARKHHKSKHHRGKRHDNTNRRAHR